MKYQGCLLAVQDMAASKRFYEEVLRQTPVMDIGGHVAFAGFSLQEGYAGLVGLAEEGGKAPSAQFQLYFEVEDLDETFLEMKQAEGLQWLHEIREYPWGQRDVRVYDPDGHIVEVAEEMGTVIRRLFRQGMTAEEIAGKTMFPPDAVKQYLD